MNITDARGPRALVVDDEADIRRVIAGYLQQEGFAVSEAKSGLQALERAEADQPDVIILDLMLPELDGVEVCRRLRTFSDAYVIMLTARAEEVDTLIGLSVGADDYMTKPFSPRELVARVRTMMRRPHLVSGIPSASGARVFGDLVIDPASREVRLGGELTELTRTEFDILNVLSSQPGLVHTRRQIVARVWGGDWIGDERIVDVHIAHIRSKLHERKAAARYVLTVRGVGFRMGPG